MMTEARVPERFLRGPQSTAQRMRLEPAACQLLSPQVVRALVVFEE